MLPRVIKLLNESFRLSCDAIFDFGFLRFRGVTPQRLQSIVLRLDIDKDIVHKLVNDLRHDVFFVGNTVFRDGVGETWFSGVRHDLAC